MKGDLTIPQMGAEMFSKLAARQSLSISLRESSYQGQVTPAKPGCVA